MMHCGICDMGWLARPDMGCLCEIKASSMFHFSTLRLRQMVASLQATLSNAFSTMKKFVF